MKSWHLLGILIVTATLLANEDDEPAVVAKVYDSSSTRIPLLTVAPEYPREARRDRIEGEVQVCFDIDREGRTRRISVRNSTNRAFEKPSIKAVRASTFRPIGEEEVLAAIKYCRKFIFSLEPQDSE